MILCIGPNDKLQVITGQAVATHVHVSGMDVDGSGNVTTYRKNTGISTATTTDISAVPASGVTRNIKTVNIRNADAASNVDVTVQHTDGTTVITLFKATLAAGQTLSYVEGTGWSLGQGAVQSLEMDYAQVTADSAAISATTEATAVTVITGNPVTYDGNTKVEIEFFSPSTVPSGELALTLVWLRDATVIGQTRYGDKARIASGIGVSMNTSIFDTPPAGSHTYSVRAFVDTANVTFKAGTGGSGNVFPIFLRVSRAIGITGSQGPAGAPGPAGQVDVQTFTANGNWTKPAWATTVKVIAIGAGGGGCGGSNRTGTTTAATACGGGGGGGRVDLEMLASALPASVPITVGAGGTGSAGAAGGTNAASPNVPGAGGMSSFGTYVIAGGGGPGPNTNRGAGGGGMGSTPPAYVTGTVAGGGPLHANGAAMDTTQFGGFSCAQGGSGFSGGGGGNASQNGGCAEYGGAGGCGLYAAGGNHPYSGASQYGGGAGASSTYVTTANAFNPGTNAGDSGTTQYGTGAAPGVSGNPPTPGANGANGDGTSRAGGGGGNGGGATAVATAGGAGGNGGTPGGGGGAGGTGCSTGSGGKGGDGGNGMVIVISR